MEEKKKLSKFGKVWIIVCVAAVVLGLLVTYIGPISAGMNSYNNHEHDKWCYTDWCSYVDYSDAFSFAMNSYDGYMWCIIFVGGALILANVVMGIIYATRKSKKEQGAENTASAVSIPTGEGEQVALERHYSSVFPIVLLVLGVLSTLIGLIILMDDDEAGIPLMVVGIVFAVVGALLRKAMKIHLVVTTKRVYVKAPFAARINLPLNRISAVGTGLFHYVSITSAAGLAGQIRLWFVPKYLEVYDTINALLNKVE